MRKIVSLPLSGENTREDASFRLLAFFLSVAFLPFCHGDGERIPRFLCLYRGDGVKEAGGCMRSVLLACLRLLACLSCADLLV